MKFLKFQAHLGSGKPNCRMVGVTDARQHDARRERETPDHEAERQRVGKAHAPFPCREAGPTLPPRPR